MRQFDVVIIGYGPVSRFLAILLSSHGHSVGIVERQKALYPLPRAVCMDHEIRRLILSYGDIQALDSFSHPAPRYQWFNSKWELLLDIDWTVESISGGQEAYFFHQPSLERALDAVLQNRPSVSLLLNYEAAHFEQDANGVTLTIRNLDSGDEEQIRGRYLIGADGANSATRTALGIGWRDFGFSSNFLVVDVAMNDGVQLKTPEAGQYCNPDQPTTFVPGGMKDGKKYRRWEFMVRGGTPAELQSPEYAWKLLSAWMNPGDGELVRQALYTFRSLVAESWQRGRVFLAGDACHLMPPFLGQGLCSGLRDAANLGWRLDLVLRDAAAPSLLAEYEIERKPHVSQVVATSIHLGSIICAFDEAAAEARDTAIKDGTAASIPAFPHLQTGTLMHSDNPGIAAIIGTLSPHAEITVHGVTGRFDALIGTGFVLVAKDRTISDYVSANYSELIWRLGIKIAYLASTGDQHEGAFSDDTGKYERFMNMHHISALLIRPDFYIFGAASNKANLDDLLAQCSAKFEVPPASVGGAINREGRFMRYKHTPAVVSSVTLGADYA